MKNRQLTVSELHQICATAQVAMPTLQKYLRGGEPMRRAMVERIESALGELGLKHLRRTAHARVISVK